MTGRRCPHCNKGMFKRFQLKKHIRFAHPESAPNKTGLSYLESIERKKRKVKNDG